MPPTIVSIHNAEHYTWGSEGGTTQNTSDAWYLMRTPGLHLIEERMPPGAAETPHIHAVSRQFFYVLEGNLTITIESQDFDMAAGQGIEVPPCRRHQVINRSMTPVRFLVVSQPPSHGDRTEVP